MVAIHIIISIYVTVMHVAIDAQDSFIFKCTGIKDDTQMPKK